jgi:hypothetical protein
MARKKARLLEKMRRNCGAVRDSSALRQPLERTALGDGGELLGMDMTSLSSQVREVGAFGFVSLQAC